MNNISLDGTRVVKKENQEGDHIRLFMYKPHHPIII